MLGGGPSLPQAIPLLKNQCCIAVNNSYQLAPWSISCWFGDVKWWDWHKGFLESWPNLLATCCQNSRVQKEAHQLGLDIHSFQRENRTKGLTYSKGMVCWNGSSGASAINYAYHLGFRKVALVGFDMRRIEGRKNFHQDHQEKDHSPFPRHLSCFPIIAKEAPALGLEIINATPDSAIKAFPYVPLEELCLTSPK